MSISPAQLTREMSASRRKIPNGAAVAFLNEALTCDTPECVVWPYSLHNGYGHILLAGCATRVASRIVCERIHGPSPSPAMDAAHSCGNRACVNWRHLRWATRQQNEADKIDHGKTKRGISSKLSAENVLAIRRSSESSYRLAPQFGVAASTIRSIRRGVNWRWL